MHTSLRRWSATVPTIWHIILRTLNVTEHKSGGIQWYVCNAWMLLGQQKKKKKVSQTKFSQREESCSLRQHQLSKLSRNEVSCSLWRNLQSPFPETLDCRGPGYVPAIFLLTCVPSPHICLTSRLLSMQPFACFARIWQKQYAVTLHIKG